MILSKPFMMLKARKNRYNEFQNIHSSCNQTPLISVIGLVSVCIDIDSYHIYLNLKYGYTALMKP